MHNQSSNSGFAAMNKSFGNQQNLNTSANAQRNPGFNTGSSFFAARRAPADPVPVAQSSVAPAQNSENGGFGGMRLEKPTYVPTFNNSAAAPFSQQDINSRFNAAPGQQSASGLRAPQVQQGVSVGMAPVASSHAIQQPSGRAPVVVSPPDDGIRNTGAISYPRDLVTQTSEVPSAHTTRQTGFAAPNAGPFSTGNTQATAGGFLEESPFVSRASPEKLPTTHHPTEEMCHQMEQLRVQTEQLQAATAVAQNFLAMIGELGQKLLELQNGLESRFSGRN